MTMNTNQVLIWLKDFKYSWLPQHISNDTHLIELIRNKVNEFEQFLIENNQDENEILIESEYQCDKPSDTEQIGLSTEPPSLPKPLDQIDENEKNITFGRPAIRLKRISLAEAENYLPPELKSLKSKRGPRKSKRKFSTYSNKKKNKKNIQTNKILSPLPSDEIPNNLTSVRKSNRQRKPIQYPSTTLLTNTSSVNNEKKKGKRKLRAIDAEDDDLYILGSISQTENPHENNDCDQVSRYIGQNGILSQTRKTNQTTITFNDDFTIKLHSRQSKIQSSNHLNDTTLITTEPICIDEDVLPMVDEQMYQDVMENNDNESLFASLDMASDRNIGTNSISNNNSSLNYNDCIEDITNDGIDPPPSSSSPNLGHLSLIT